MSLSARMALRSASGIAAKASLVGAKMVNGPSPLRVSTNPASTTAVTSVDNTGLFEAAVAAGSSAIPSKEPSPSVGTAEQAAPAFIPVRSAIASVVVVMASVVVVIAAVVVLA